MATSVFEAATKKTNCGTEAKIEGFISFATVFSLIDYTTPFRFPIKVGISAILKNLKKNFVCKFRTWRGFRGAVS